MPTSAAKKTVTVKKPIKTENPQDEHKILIKQHFSTQEGRPDIRTLWSDEDGSRYRVNFYIDKSEGIIILDRMIASYFVTVNNDGQVIVAEDKDANKENPYDGDNLRFIV